MNPSNNGIESFTLPGQRSETTDYYIFMAIKDKKFFKSIKIKASDECSAEERIKRQYPDWEIFYLWKGLRNE